MPNFIWYMAVLHDLIYLIVLSSCSEIVTSIDISDEISLEIVYA